MRKISILIVITIIIISALFNLIIPASIHFQTTKVISAKKEGLIRLLSNQNLWNKCINENNNLKKIPSSEFIFNNIKYLATFNSTSSLKIIIDPDGLNLESTLTLISQEPDSTLFIWEYNSPTSINPYTRIKNYANSKKIGHDVESILTRLNTCYSKVENVYGVDIKREEINDSILIATNIISTAYPSEETIYGLINNLKGYSKRHEANITGYPMLNISQLANKQYDIKVALPVSKELPSYKNITTKRMMGRGKIIVMSVHGGELSIKEANKKFMTYINDYRFQAPGIPFQSLITDRSLIKDTTKWITKISYPVM